MPSPGQTRMQRFTFWISDHEREALDRAARAVGLNRATFIRLKLFDQLVVGPSVGPHAWLGTHEQLAPQHR